MKNADSAHIQELFKWWNGWVFTFDTAAKEVTGNDGNESSGMEEAELGLDAENDPDVEIEPATGQQDHPWDDLEDLTINIDDFIDRFNNSTVGTPDGPNKRPPVIAPSSSQPAPRQNPDTPANQPHSMPREAEDILSYISNLQHIPQQENVQVASTSKTTKPKPKPKPKPNQRAEAIIDANLEVVAQEPVERVAVVG
jgi:hypothetical protein